MEMERARKATRQRGDSRLAGSNEINAMSKKEKKNMIIQILRRPPA